MFIYLESDYQGVWNCCQIKKNASPSVLNIKAWVFFLHTFIPISGWTKPYNEKSLISVSVPIDFNVICWKITDQGAHFKVLYGQGAFFIMPWGQSTFVIYLKKKIY